MSTSPKETSPSLLEALVLSTVLAIALQALPQWTTNRFLVGWLIDHGWTAHVADVVDGFALLLALALCVGARERSGVELCARCDSFHGKDRAPSRAGASGRSGLPQRHPTAQLHPLRLSPPIDRIRARGWRGCDGALRARRRMRLPHPRGHRAAHSGVAISPRPSLASASKRVPGARASHSLGGKMSGGSRPALTSLQGPSAMGQPHELPPRSSTS